MRRLALRYAAAQNRDGTFELRLGEAWRFIIELPGGSL